MFDPLRRDLRAGGGFVWVTNQRSPKDGVQLQIKMARRVNAPANSSLRRLDEIPSSRRINRRIAKRASHSWT